MSEIIHFKYPEVRAAYEKKLPIRFRWPSSEWFDYDYSSMEPPTFDNPLLIWSVKPAILHPIFDNVLKQFNAQFGGVA